MNDWVNFWRKALKHISYFSGWEFCGSMVSPSMKEKFVRALFLAVEALESISKRHKDVRQRGGEAEAGPARSVWPARSPWPCVHQSTGTKRAADTAGHAALKLRMDDGRWTWTSITTIQGHMGPLFEKKKKFEPSVLGGEKEVRWCQLGEAGNASLWTSCILIDRD